MKRIISIFLILFLLTGCGKNAEPQPEAAETLPASATETLSDSATEPEELIAEEIEMDGIRFTEYRTREGVLVWDEYVMPDGSYGEEHYYENGMLSYLISHQTDGSVNEFYCYPDGTPHKDIFHNADGSFLEQHYANDGQVDQATMTFYPGTVVYTYVTDAQGNVTHTLELAEDLSGEEWELFDDGRIQESRYAPGKILDSLLSYHPEEGWWTEYRFYEDGTIRQSIGEDPNTGIHDEWEYYPTGSQKSISVDYMNSDAYMYTEYYANGLRSHYIYVEEDGTKTETKYNQAGYYTYLYSKSATNESEHIADENGNLLKYTENGTVYEGDAIPSWILESFAEMQKSTQNRVD